LLPHFLGLAEKALALILNIVMRLGYLDFAYVLPVQMGLPSRPSYEIAKLKRNQIGTSEFSQSQGYLQEEYKRICRERLCSAVRDGQWDAGTPDLRSLENGRYCLILDYVVTLPPFSPGELGSTGFLESDDFRIAAHVSPLSLHTGDSRRNVTLVSQVLELDKSWFAI